MRTHLRDALRDWQQGRPEAAVSRLEQSLAGLLDTAPAAGTTTVPFDLDALQMLVDFRLRLGQPERADAAMRPALLRAPTHPRVLALAAAVAHSAGDSLQALAHSERALQADPQNLIATAIFVEHAAEQLKVSAAIRVSEVFLSRQPQAHALRLARPHAWMLAGDAERAHRDVHTALQAMPQSMPARQSLCFTSLYLDQPALETARLHAQVGPGFAGASAGTAAPAAAAVHSDWRPGERPLRVGLVSPDLRRHPVGELIAPLLQAMDRERVEFTCYSDAVTPDAHTATLQALSARWRDSVRIDDTRLAEAVRHDGIDVLIDLAGYGQGGRPALYAQRHAPLQLGWLGYLHPTGLPGMDAVLGDAVLGAAMPQVAGCEPGLALDAPFLCFQAPLEAPPTVPAATARSPGEGIRFGSFNHLAKLSTRTVAVWSALLRALPGATLTLSALGIADEGVRVALARRFAAQDIDPTRLRLLPPTTDRAAYLARFAEIDIALDPLPFNAGMTGLQGLWQGVPTLTLPGERMAARMGASMLTALGMPEAIAADPEDFAQRGQALADAVLADPQAYRTQLRERLRASALMDARRFAEAFAKALESRMQRASAPAS